MRSGLCFLHCPVRYFSCSFAKTSPLQCACDPAKGAETPIAPLSAAQLIDSLGPKRGHCMADQEQFQTPPLVRVLQRFDLAERKFGSSGTEQSSRGDL